MLKLNKNQKLNRLLTITLLVVSSISMQSTFAEETTITENDPMTHHQVALIDWSQKTQLVLTSRLDKKLQNQLIAKDYSIELTQLVKFVEPVIQNTNIVLAENSIQ